MSKDEKNSKLTSESCSLIAIKKESTAESSELNIFESVDNFQNEEGSENQSLLRKKLSQQTRSDDAEESESSNDSLFFHDDESTSDKVAADGEQETVQENEKDLALKMFLLVQFEIGFRLLLLFCSVFSAFVSIKNFVEEFCRPQELMDFWTGDVVNLFVMDIAMLFDVISMITYKLLRWEQKYCEYKSRSVFLILIDVISLIPFEFIYIYSVSKPMVHYVYLIRLRYVLRLNRICSKLRQMDRRIDMNIMTSSYAEMVTIIIILIVFVASLEYIKKCFGIVCDESVPSQVLYIAASKVTQVGSILPYTATAYDLWMITVINILAFFIVKCYNECKLTSAFKQKYKPWAIFSTRLVYIFRNFSKAFKDDFLLKTTCKDYYDHFWKHRSGVLHISVERIIPNILMTELQLEMAWKAFQHSHLFRKEELNFLHYLSRYVEHQFMIPGQVLYQKGMLKDKMIYVVSGTVQIISELDGETPILSFTDGSCFGETSLFISYKSSSTVVCSTYCELTVLSKSEFDKIRSKFPENYRNLQKRIIKRYKNAKMFVDICEYERHLYRIKELPRRLSITRVTYTLAKLLSADENFEANYIKRLKISERLWFKLIIGLSFCPYYLDMLVIPLQETLLKDSVFLRSKFPYVFQPKSKIITCWNMLTALVTVALYLTYPYYTVFHDDVSGSYDAFMYCVTVLWILDFYIRTSTAVRERHVFLNNVSEIALHRAGSLNYFLDLFATLPIEVFVKFVIQKLPDKIWYFLQINRLFKYYKISYFLEPYRKSINHDVVVYRYIKYSIYVLLIIYWIAAIFELILHYDDPETSLIHTFLRNIRADTVAKRLLGCLYLASRIVTGISFRLNATGQALLFYYPMTIVQVFFCIFFAIFISDVSAAETLRSRSKLILQERLALTCFFIKNMGDELTQTVYKYFEHQWEANFGISIIYPERLLYDTPRDMKLIMMYRKVKNSFLNVPFFQEIEEPLMMEICAMAAERHNPPGHILTYAGEIARHVYIIEFGYCDKISADRQVVTLLGPGDCFALIECCMDIPIIHNVITRTSIKFYAIEYAAFCKIVQPYPKVKKEIEETVKMCAFSIRSDESRSLQEDEVFKIPKQEEESVKKFGYRLVRTTDQGRQFHAPFDALGYWGFIRYFLMRYTFTSHGKIVWYWELFRCIFAMMSALFCLFPMREEQWVVWTIRFLDFSAYADIYFRHHVCYFSDKGIEITHPLKTATNYWQHAFLTDCIAAFPVYNTCRLLLRQRITSQIRVYFNINKVLQIYRIWKWFQYKLSAVQANRLLEPIKYAPIYIIATFYLSNMILDLSCVLDNTIPATDIYEEGTTCHEDSWITNSIFKKPISIMRTSFYGLYFVTSILTGAGSQGFALRNILDVNTITFLAIGGWLAFELLTAKIIGLNLSRNTDIIEYQHEMAALMKFFEGSNISQKMKDDFVQHSDYNFRRKRCRRYKDVLKCFNNAFAEDILFGLFGSAFKQSTIFEHANISFVRNFLRVGFHGIILKTGIISKVNDVSNEIYFLLKGKVDVFGPDNSYLLTLPDGSMFGNLDDVPFSRRTLTFRANGNVELYTMDSHKFYKIIKRYPRLHANWLKLTVVHTDYLNGKLQNTVIDEHIKDSNAITNKRNRLGLGFLFKVRHRSKCLNFWEIFILVTAGFLGFTMELYQKILMEASVWSICILYGFDGLHILKIYIKFQTAFENEMGIEITDLKLIAKNYLKDRVGFILDVITIIPFELSCIPFTHKPVTALYVWSFARSNRLLRVFDVIGYFNKQHTKMNINVCRVRILSTWFQLFIVSQVAAAVLLQINCIDDTINSSPEFNCDLNISRIEKLQTYLTHLGVTIAILTRTQDIDFVPHSSLLILYIVILMFVARIIMAIITAEACSIYEAERHHKFAYADQIQLLNHYATTLKVSRPLVNRLHKYSVLLFEKQNGVQFPTLLEKAPYYMREAALMSMFGSHIENHPRLKFCHRDLVRQMAAQMRTATFFPGNYIAFKKDLDECMYFIHKGRVAALSVDTLYKEVVDRELVAGESFGFDQGMSPFIGHEFTYKAVEFTVLVILKRETWFFMLDFFPASKEMIYDESYKAHQSID